MSRIHRYPARTLLADYGRGIVGAGLSGMFWVLSPVTAFSMLVFGGLTALFLTFILRTALRQHQRIETSDAGIGIVGRAPLAWRELDGLRLRYYAGRRGKGRGWMTMTLKAGGRRLSVDSMIEGFDEIAARAAQAARERPLVLNDTTAANLAALGLSADAAESRLAYGARG
jgi:hypothetical protein